MGRGGADSSNSSLQMPSKTGRAWGKDKGNVFKQQQKRNALGFWVLEYLTFNKNYFFF